MELIAHSTTLTKPPNQDKSFLAARPSGEDLVTCIAQLVLPFTKQPFAGLPCQHEEFLALDPNLITGMPKTGRPLEVGWHLNIAWEPPS